MNARIALASWRLLATALVIGVGAPPTWAQTPAAHGVIDGVVTDTNLVSLGDATASILGSSIQVVTGANGRFRILGLPAGHHILSVRRLGYAPTSTALQIAGGDTLHLSFALEKVATALDTVMIAGKRLSPRMAEFEDRRKLGFGHFITQADIENRNATFLKDLLRTLLSVDISSHGFTDVAVSHRGGCAFLIYLDGLALPTPTNLNDLPTPKNLGGIEVYSGPATIPLQYKKAGSGFCGVILVWTRDGF